MVKLVISLFSSIQYKGVCPRRVVNSTHNTQQYTAVPDKSACFSNFLLPRNVFPMETKKNILLASRSKQTFHTTGITCLYICNGTVATVCPLLYSKFPVLSLCNKNAHAAGGEGSHMCTELLHCTPIVCYYTWPLCNVTQL